MMLTLISRTIRRSVVMLSAFAALLALFQVSLVATAASFEDGQNFDRLAGLAPAFIQQFLGSALTSFAGMTSVSFYEPLILIVIVQVAIYLATEPAGDVESGLVDLLLARPVPRHRLVTRSLLTMSGASIGLPLVMVASLWICLRWLAPAGARWPDTRTIGDLMAHLTAVAWCFGGIALAAASFARRRGAAQSAVGVTAVALYFLDFVGDAWSRAGWAAPLSPFHYFHGARILAGTAHSSRELGLLLTLGGLAVVVAYWRFQRRDL
jgi:ABC-2 type transport system permease protein